MNVDELMTTDPIAVGQDHSLLTAQELMHDHDLRHLPVVDEDGALVGILSDRDVRAYLPWKEAGEGPDLAQFERGEHPVSAAMQPDPWKLVPDDDASEVVDLMVNHRVGAVPVVEQGTERLVGIVSYVDVLRALRSQL